MVQETSSTFVQKKELKIEKTHKEVCFNPTVELNEKKNFWENLIINLHTQRQFPKWQMFCEQNFFRHAAAAAAAK